MTAPNAALSLLTAHPKAVAGTAEAASVAWHYGDPAGEQWALAAGTGVTDLSHLGVVTVTGVDRCQWLTTLSSQVITAGQPVGERGEEQTSGELLLLDAAGHIAHGAAWIDDGETTWLLTDGGKAPALVDFLDSMRFMFQVTVTNETEAWGVLGVVVPLAKGADQKVSKRVALAAMQASGAHVAWVDPWPGVVSEGTTYSQALGLDHPGTARARILACYLRPELATAATRVLENLKILARSGTTSPRLAGLGAWEALRLEDWRPRYGELDERTMPHEVDLLRTAVNLNKGCYCGQETVARIVNIGRPPRRAVLLQLDGANVALPAPGTPVAQVRGERSRQVGQVLTAARHADLGIIALALVRRATDPEAELEVAGVPALQEIIVDPAGRSAASPAEVPGRTAAGESLARNPALRRPTRREVGQ